MSIPTRIHDKEVHSRAAETKKFTAARQVRALSGLDRAILSHESSFTMGLSFLTPVLQIHHHRPQMTAQLTPTTPKAASIPHGATLEPALCEDSISRKLENLSFAYEQSEHRCLRYRCRHGHVVTSRPGTPACRSCPVCHAQASQPCMNTTRRKLTLCQLGAVARDRGGTLLSMQYENARSPLIWRCARGHVWKATASNIRSANSWCPECARQRRKATIEDMQAIADGLGGECLSTDYISEHVKLRWRCGNGHEFFLAPNNIRRTPTGARKPSWCKICRRDARRVRLAPRRTATLS